jgi:predicted dehydrogenase
MALDGGALMTQCSHFLDLMLWIGGEVHSVSAVMRNLAHPYIETEDTGLVTVRFLSGALGSLQYTTNVYRENLEGSMLVLGSSGSIKVGGQYLNTLERWDVDGWEVPVLERSAQANDYGTYRGSMSNHDKVIDNVIQTVRGKEQATVSSQQGRKSVEVLQAAYISAITGREVELPLCGTDYRFKVGEQPPLSGHRKSTT